MKDIYSQKWRLWEVDFLRGIAVIMMIIFHYFWSMEHFGVYNIGIKTGLWSTLALLTAGIFIFLVGISLTLSYSKINHKKIDYFKKYLKRGIKIFVYGLIVTIVSYFLIPIWSYSLEMYKNR